VGGEFDVLTLARGSINRGRPQAMRELNRLLRYRGLVPRLPFRDAFNGPFPRPGSEHSAISAPEPIGRCGVMVVSVI